MALDDPPNEASYRRWHAQPYAGDALSQMLALHPPRLPWWRRLGLWLVGVVYGWLDLR